MKFRFDGILDEKRQLWKEKIDTSTFEKGKRQKVENLQRTKIMNRRARAACDVCQRLPVGGTQSQPGFERLAEYC